MATTFAESIKNVILTGTVTENRRFSTAVGVINKFDGDREPSELTFSEFKHWFGETKRRERDAFHSLEMNDENCTTKGVFLSIERIFKILLHSSITNGMVELDESIIKMEERMYAELAPPSHLYLSSGESGATNYVLRKSMLTDEFQQNAKEQLKSALQGQEVFPFSSGPDMGMDEALVIATELSLEWPMFILGDIDTSMKRRESFAKIENRLKKFCFEVIEKIDAKFCSGGEDSVFAQGKSPFHHIERFPKLCASLHQGMLGLANGQKVNVINKLTKFLSHVWVVEEPSGQLTMERLTKVVAEARHLVITEFYHSLSSALSQIPVDWEDREILDEPEDFKLKRRMLAAQYEGMKDIQAKQLIRCRDLVGDDAELKQQLHVAAEELNHLLEHSPSCGWEASFWEEGFSRAIRRKTGERWMGLICPFALF